MDYGYLCKLTHITWPLLTPFCFDFFDTPILTTPNDGKDMENQELSFTAGGNVRWHSHFGKCLAVSYKIKHCLIIQSGNNTP
jgi:hypothetical protein